MDQEESRLVDGEESDMINLDDPHLTGDVDDSSTNWRRCLVSSLNHQRASNHLIFTRKEPFINTVDEETKDHHGKTTSLADDQIDQQRTVEGDRRTAVTRDTWPKKRINDNIARQKNNASDMTLADRND